MELTFGEQGDPGGKAEGVAEVAEGESAAEPTDAISPPALIQLRIQCSCFVLAQRRGALWVLDGMLLMQRSYLDHRSLLGHWRGCPNRGHVQRSRTILGFAHHKDTVTSGH